MDKRIEVMLSEDSKIAGVLSALEVYLAEEEYPELDIIAHMLGLKTYKEANEGHVESQLEKDYRLLSDAAVEIHEKNQYYAKRIEELEAKLSAYEKHEIEETVDGFC